MPTAKHSIREEIRDKIKEIEGYLEELTGFMPENFKTYVHNFKTKAACERYFEKIIEASVDLAFLIIKNKRFRIPKSDNEAFAILTEERVISADLASKLKDAKGMRNIIAHQYGNVDDKVVFISITEELVNDINEFIGKIKKIIDKDAGGRI